MQYKLCVFLLSLLYSQLKNLKNYRLMQFLSSFLKSLETPPKQNSKGYIIKTFKFNNLCLILNQINFTIFVKQT